MSKIVTVLVGPPCSGKSTYLKTIDYDFVTSSDDIVEILTSREGLQYHEFFSYPSNSQIKKEHNNIFKQLIIESQKYIHVVLGFKGNEKLLLERNQYRFKREGKYVDETDSGYVLKL
jgi:predicted kinase